MRRLYWRPSGITRMQLLLLAVISSVSVIGVEKLQVTNRQPHYAAKIAAARLAANAMNVIREEKALRGITPDPEADPHRTGMIGGLISPVTSNTGHLPAKQLSANPNFAAVVVHLLKRAGVEEGDAVAVGISGSFPALNVNVYAALQTLKATPLVIASMASSEWGATDVNYMWIDMERSLRERHLISFSAIGVSPGGIDDRGFGMSKAGRELLVQAMERSGAELLKPRSLAESIDQRMHLYLEKAGERRIGAYINVGGGSASVGTTVGKHMYRPGLNTEVPSGATDSVMTRLGREGVPIIHFSSIARLADRYELPFDAAKPSAVGVGGVYSKQEYNPWLALAAILLIVGTIGALVRMDRSSQPERKKPTSTPENSGDKTDKAAA